ncbi:GNAT family N-acetyltransferase [Mariluticola halotolerans]|uniref:GNAT family N-acetyltransferase n=1 Tax=Mariluticola halotolerans TaxID=2909283 RepID=UPI0026E3ED3C|nr:GNAT family N-acetyltransferase [Mariluticola halotolerans]UJQ94562.1 GNAT family N-acetyltransferase [Mariluticola halotolerans]
MLKKLSDAPKRSLLDSLVIRACCPDDAAALCALINLPGVRQGTLQLPFQQPDHIRTQLEKPDPDALHLIASIDGHLIGSAGLSRFRGRRRHAADFGMMVHDDYAGRGVGHALAKELIETADQWLGIDRIELTVFADNQPAIALYKKLGFKTEGTLQSFALRDGAYIDAVSMARLRETISLA